MRTISVARLLKEAKQHDECWNDVIPDTLVETLKAQQKVTPVEQCPAAN